MKKLLALLLCLAMVLSLAACGGEDTPTTAPTTAPTTVPTTEPTTEPTEPPITVEQVYASAQDAMKNAEATRMHMEFSYGVSYEEGEGENAVTTDISYDMLIEIIASEDPFGSFTTTSVAMATEGLDMDITMDMYMVEEDGLVVIYNYLLGSWGRSETGMTAEEFLTSDQMPQISTNEVWSGGEMPADMTLDPFTQDMNGTEVYILRATTTVSGLDGVLEEMGVSPTEETDEFALPVVYYVDAESYTILRMEADMQGMMDILADSMSESILGEDAETSGLEMTISNVVYDLGYGAQEIPALPQEALDQDYGEDPTVIPSEDPTTDPTADPSVNLPLEGKATDMGNGTFVLPCGDEAFTITCPDGWSGEVYAENNVWIYSEGYTYYGDFYYFTGWTVEDFEDQIQMDIDDLKDADIFISSGDGPVCEGYTTKVVMGEGESYCYAWTPAGDGYLLMLLADYTDEPDFETMLNEMLGQLTPYTGEFAVNDGSFSLPCGDRTLTVTCPEGWDGELYDVNNVWIYNGDGSIYGDYYYWEGWTEDDILTLWIQPDVDSLKDENTFVSQGDGPVCDGYTTMVVVGTETSYYYAWAPMGDGYFLLQVYDWDGGDDSAELLPQMLDTVTSDTAE